MKTKKSKKANLENNRWFYRQMGLLLSLGLLFITFEYTQADISELNYDPTEEMIVEVEYMPITKAKKTTLPPPPPIIIDLIIIDPFNNVIDEDIELIPEEIDTYSEPTVFDFPETEEVDPDAIFDFVEKMPEFPGGYEAMLKYLSENIKYPAWAMEMGIQGRVFVKFVVNKNGKIVDVQIIKSIDKYLDAEAVRVVQNMPDWSPGEQSGKAVNVSFRIPINFKIK